MDINGYIQDAEGIRTGQTAYQPMSNVHPPYIFIRWHPLCPKLADGYDQTKRISPDTERIHRMVNGQEMYANLTGTDREFYCPLHVR